MRQRKQSTTTYPILFFMANSTDHLTGQTGLTPTVTISKNGASFGAAAGAVAEVGNGWYKLAGNATDRNTLGTLIIHAEAATADTFDMDLFIVSYDPFTIIGPSTYSDTILYPSLGGDPLADVEVYCYADSGYSALVDEKETDSNGLFTFYLEPGTYYFRALKEGYTIPDWSAVVT